MDDLISRQALLNKFEPWLKVKDYSDGELNMLKAILYEIRFMSATDINVGTKLGTNLAEVSTDVPDINVGELISRQAAIDALRDYLVGKRCPDDGTLTCRLIENEVINKLPPIRPEQCEDAVSRKTILKFLDDWMSALEDNVHNQSVSDLKIIKRDFANLPPVTPKQRWIPVTENTLPDKNRVVVVCGEKGTWDYGTYRGHGDNIHFWHWKKNTFKHVYWWMYKEDALQMPYKGKE